MSGRIQTFTHEIDNNAAVEAWVSNLESQGATNITIRSTGSGVSGMMLTTITWDSSSDYPYTDVVIETEADTSASYFLTEITAATAELDSTTGKYISTITAKRVAKPQITIENEYENSAATTVVDNIVKTGNHSFKVHKKKVTVSTDNSSITGDGTEDNPLTATFTGITIIHLNESGVAMTGTAPNGDYADRYVKYVSLEGNTLTIHYDSLRYS